MFGSQGLLVGLMGSGLAFIVFLPMVIGKMLGAGDLKLMLAFGMATSWVNVLWTSIYSIIWAAIFGVIYAVAHKQFRNLILNTISVASLRKEHNIETLKIPFTIALLMGWLHQIFNVMLISGGGN